jgi:hypothetical protein
VEFCTCVIMLVLKKFQILENFRFQCFGGRNTQPVLSLVRQEGGRLASIKEWCHCLNPQALKQRTKILHKINYNLLQPKQS